MPLRRLTTVLDDLFFTAGINFTHSLFAHLTHLALLFRAEPNAQWDEWKGLALIPNLTHLAFVHERSLPVFQGALATCSALQVFVYLSSWDQGLGSLAQDTRFVCMITPPFIRDWQIGARGGDDFWVRAEQFIAKRISGEVDPGSVAGPTISEVIRRFDEVCGHLDQWQLGRPDQALDLPSWIIQRYRQLKNTFKRNPPLLPHYDPPAPLVLTDSLRIYTQTPSQWTVELESRTEVSETSVTSCELTEEVLTLSMLNLDSRIFGFA
ncbi:hypothetical protein B0H13DRAFT_2438177 [Mycena leptocephala]|nr:hypothetical protein B0H13DRAFT_2438177 [Mycena leptocephala]